MSEIVRRLQFVQAPRVLLQLMAHLWHAYENKELLRPTYDALETFAGSMSVTNALRDRGLRAVGFEISFIRCTMTSSVRMASYTS